MERERRVAEVDKASRNLTAGKASSKDRKVLVEWGIDPERVAEVHLNAIEKRGNPPTQAYQEAIRRISGAYYVVFVLVKWEGAFEQNGCARSILTSRMRTRVPAGLRHTRRGGSCASRVR